MYYPDHPSWKAVCRHPSNRYSWIRCHLPSRALLWNEPVPWRLQLSSEDTLSAVFKKMTFASRMRSACFGTSSCPLLSRYFREGMSWPTVSCRRADSDYCEWIEPSEPHHHTWTNPSRQDPAPCVHTRTRRGRRKPRRSCWGRSRDRWCRPDAAVRWEKKLYVKDEIWKCGNFS